MDTLSKLSILADAAKYDVACTSSGSQRGPRKGMVGKTTAAGCCHSFTPDGRCVTLLKVLMSNACSFDCAYCVNRRGAATAKATFQPRELAELTMDFYKRNYIEGLFLSSGVLGDPSATTEAMAETLRLLREEYRFGGYIHAKVIPGTDPELIDRLGRLADRLSANVELPSSTSLERLCPQKGARAVLAPMAQIAATIRQDRALGPGTARGGGNGSGSVPRALESGVSRAMARGRRRSRGGQGGFAPAGQSTQLMVGASPEDDHTILSLASALYDRYDLKRVFFSAYIPIIEDRRLPALEAPVPLQREHRLYQADWLMRFYHFSADELVAPDHPYLDLEVDPKLAWALTHMDRFPVEVNHASLEELLRVPGIGPVGARRLLRARRSGPLTFDDVARTGLTLSRARHFITCQGQRDPASPADPELIRERVIDHARSSSYNRTQRARADQLTLF